MKHIRQSSQEHTAGSFYVTKDMPGLTPAMYNQSLYDYCQRNGITFTRSRSYKKNDSCHVEQKNWTVVRRVIGYDRFSSRAAFKALGYIYMLLRLYNILTSASPSRNW